ncbi:hypothetical protein ACP4OV_003607 [Aristida adscensionis]
MAGAAQQLVLVALVAALLVGAEAAIGCGQVNSAIGPCIAYARGAGSGPSPACCSGVRGLSAAAKSTADRRAACNCLKSGAAKISGLNAAKAASIPSKCGVSLPYSISASIDCSRVG